MKCSDLRSCMHYTCQFWGWWWLFFPHVSLGGRGIYYVTGLMRCSLCQYWRFRESGCRAGLFLYYRGSQCCSVSRVEFWAAWEKFLTTLGGSSWQLEWFDSVLFAACVRERLMAMVLAIVSCKAEKCAGLMGDWRLHLDLSISLA